MAIWQNQLIGQFRHAKIEVFQLIQDLTKPDTIEIILCQSELVIGIKGQTFGKSKLNLEMDREVLHQQGKKTLGPFLHKD